MSTKRFLCLSISDSWAEQFLPNLDDLEAKTICQSLEDFSFSKDKWAVDDSANLFRNEHALEQDDDDDFEPEPAGFNDDFNDGAPADMEGAAPVEDFFVGDQAVNDDYVHDDPPSPSVGSEGAMADEAREHGAGGGGFVQFDPRKAPNERDLVLAMTDNGEGGMMYDYFDRSVLGKNWAGPEHWKLRKVVRRRRILS